MKSKFINLTGLVCGCAPLVGGLIIFFIWWAGRAFFAEDLDGLESIGFVWITCSFLMATFGLVRSINFLIKGDRTTRLKSSMGLLLILLNAPIFCLVAYKQEDIAKRVYIKVYNYTKHDNLEITIQGWDFEYQLGIFDDNESLVGYYYPKCLDDDPTDSSPIPLDVRLILKDEFSTHYLELPSSIKGDCESVYIDELFRYSNDFSQISKEVPVVNEELSIDTFSAFPDGIDGCACYFSNNAEELAMHSYIYANNYGEISFLKINGVMMRFVQYHFQELSATSSIAKYRYGNYELKVVANDGERNGDETWLKSGTIELSNNKGEKLIKSFYGECGC